MLTESLPVTIGVQAVGGITVLVGAGTVGVTVSPAVTGMTDDGEGVIPSGVGVAVDSAPSNGKLHETTASQTAINP
jgi:hypothetical protein